MILKELFYFDLDANLNGLNSYDDSSDLSVMKPKDTRKTRLSLKQINRLRKISDLHMKEQEAELDFIARMYAPPPEESGGGMGMGLG